MSGLLSSAYRFLRIKSLRKRFILKWACYKIPLLWIACLAAFPIANSHGQYRNPNAIAPVPQSAPKSPASSNNLVRQVNHEQPGYMTTEDMNWQMNGAASGSCGCGGSAACGVCNRIPKAVQMCPPMQPTGVTAGACKPCITGIDCAQDPFGEKRWCDAQPVDFEPLWHGEYIGPVRLQSLLEYRMRVNDEMILTYIPSRQKVNEEYRLMVGDELGIRSVSDDSIRRDKVTIQPDGSIVVPMLVDAPVQASGKTISQLRKDLESAYKKYIVNPAIDVEPVKVNTAVEDLKDAVNGPFAAGGRALNATVNPDGKIQLPGLGSVFVLGLTLDEIKREINLRYREKYVGIEVEPRFVRSAPHFIFVFGEVTTQGKFELTGPTTVTEGLALSGGIRLGGNNRQIVIYRRAEDWRLISTVLDLRGAHIGKRPNPSDEIWLRDGDLIIVPPKPIKVFNNAVQQIFTDGVYKLIPFQGISIQRQ